jgi:hypothetical protein
MTRFFCSGVSSNGDHDLDGNVYRTQAARRKSATEGGRDCEYGFNVLPW